MKTQPLRPDEQHLPQHNGGGVVGNLLSMAVFLFVHVACFFAIWTGVSVKSLVACVVLYWTRMFLVTGVYHRYFSHRSYKMGRPLQFILGFLGTSCVQKGPLWWASVHRQHHRYSDGPKDVHSPKQRGFWYSHIGWILSSEHVETDMRGVKDMAKYPELIWLNAYHWVAPLCLAAATYALDGWRGAVVGFCWSTVLLAHCTYTINSLAHVIGKRRYETTDTSRNHWFLAFITMGEGWHNNHHHYMNSVKQGFYWWELDVSYYILRAMQSVGLVWDLKKPSARVLEANRVVKPVKQVVGEALAAAKVAMSERYEAASRIVDEKYDAASHAAGETYEAAAQAVGEKVQAVSHAVDEQYAAASHAAGETYEAARTAVTETVDAATAAVQEKVVKTEPA